MSERGASRNNPVEIIMTEDLKNKRVLDRKMFDGNFRTHFLSSLKHWVLYREYQFSLLAILSLENQQSCFHSFLFLHILQKGLFGLWAHGWHDTIAEHCW